MVAALLALANAETPTFAECAKSGHEYGPWFKQEQMYYLPEQPAHKCKKCGSFQNSSGRLMQLVKSGEGGLPGGLGKLTLKEADAQLDKEILKDFGTWEKYKEAKALPGY